MMDDHEARRETASGRIMVIGIIIIIIVIELIVAAFVLLILFAIPNTPSPRGQLPNLVE